MIHYHDEDILYMTMEDHNKFGLNSYRVDEFITYCRNEISSDYAYAYNINGLNKEFITCGSINIEEYGINISLEVMKFFDFYLLQSWPTYYIVPKTLLGVWLFTNWWWAFIE